jgi:hypothetical protein
MLSRSKSSSVSDGKLYLMYMWVGIASAPLAFIYAVLSVSGKINLWSTLSLLGTSLIVSLFVWRYLERKWAFNPRGVEFQQSQISNHQSQSIGISLALVGAELAFFANVSSEVNIIESLPPHSVMGAQQNVG